MGCSFYVGKLNSFFRRRAAVLYSMAYAATVILFLWNCSQFYLPGKGFTYLIMFGEKQHARYLPELKAVNHYEFKDSFGYDAQYYAQIAMHPRLDEPALKTAVDNLPYRARRILFCWTAYAVAGGDPIGALHVYAVQNIVCWLLLAVLLLRWFPPGSLGNFVRWFGVLLSFGLCFSVRGSLVDGPSLLLLAIAMALLEAKRPWASALVLGVAGLGKETNILGAAALLRAGPRTWRHVLAIVGQGALVFLPLAWWMVCLKIMLDSGGDAGARNFAAPLTSYFAKWAEIWGQLRAEGLDSVAKWTFLMLISLTVQFGYFVFRPRWGDAWWRVGVVYAVLMVVLGDAVWEGYPVASSRVLLPMTLAFNILVPRGPRWALLLLLGNLTVFSSFDTLKPPGRESYDVNGPSALRIVKDSGRIVEAIFDARWYHPEKSRFEFWRWSSGSAALTLRNPHPFPLEATVSFGLRGEDDREVRVQAGDQTMWSGTVSRDDIEHVQIERVIMPSGDSVWQFETDRPAKIPAGSTGDPRAVAFNIRNLTIKITGRIETPGDPQAK